MTCIDRAFAKKLNLGVIQHKKRTKVLMLNTLVEHPDKNQLSSVDQTCMKNIVAWTVSNLATDTSVVVWSEQKKWFPHLKDTPFPKLPQDSIIKIILGVDYSALFANHQVVQSPKNNNNPMTMRLSLGWTCLGSRPTNNNNQLLEKDMKKVFPQTPSSTHWQNPKNPRPNQNDATQIKSSKCKILQIF